MTTEEYEKLINKLARAVRDGRMTFDEIYNKYSCYPTLVSDVRSRLTDIIIEEFVYRHAIAAKVRNGELTLEQIKNKLCPDKKEEEVVVEQPKKASFDDVYAKYAEAILSGAITFEQVSEKFTGKQK